ncbi:hypothetical protein EBL_c00420 [Shimwellia blattae DSM 4481 = NBRC 105725]|uniref:Uncharacterized protein n=1 Tax=Shimwellia blattae (strain ATCC 29907 / DSM 4481 / JCM 1650 / NBRC 105725 / CDC 9005-74) TaxID=630626 RepID=I2B3S5_SHIBC|nr:hypothetical protein EBL_c00420 [Shimwellia blattae DSM 4481 = NBRC 105725]
MCKISGVPFRRQYYCHASYNHSFCRNIFMGRLYATTVLIIKEE